MSENSLNAKCGIEGFSPFQNNLAHELGYIRALSPISCPNQINILKLEQLNYRMVISNYKGDPTG